MTAVQVVFPARPTGITNTVDSVADLRALASDGLDEDTNVIVTGAGVFEWSGASLATDDGLTVLKPDDKTSLQAGRWLIAVGAASGAPFVPRGTGAVTRPVQGRLRETIALLDFVPTAYHDDILAGTSTQDLTDYFIAALAYIDSLPRGGEILFPPGVCVGFFNAAKASADFERRVTLRGAGKGATQLRPRSSGAVVLSMIGRNRATVRDLSVMAGDAYQASIGIVLARTSGSPNCNNNKFENIEVFGNFSKAAVVTVAAESNEWHNCLIQAGSGSSGVCMIGGHDPAATNIALTSMTAAQLGVTPGDLVSSANTDTKFVATEFYCDAVSGADTVILSGGHSFHFTASTWIAPTARSHVRFVDPNGGILGGQTTFLSCHFEGLQSTGAIFYAAVSGTTYLQGIRDIGSTIVTYLTGSKYLDYDRTVAANLLAAEQCQFSPGRHLDAAITGLDLYADNLTNSVVDFMNLRGAGAVIIFGSVTNSRIRGNDIRCNSATGSDFSYMASALPTAGTYPKGVLVLNSAAAAGAPIGWQSIHGGSMDTDPGGMTVTTTNTSPQATLGGSYSVVYEGGRYYLSTFGEAVVRKKSGTTVYFNANMGSTGAQNLNVSGAVFGTFKPAGRIELEGSATYDPPNLADGAGATTTVTCTGASLGMFAEASFSLDLQGITLTAWVSASNTVSVRFQNESGGAIDLASGTLRVRAK